MRERKRRAMKSSSGSSSELDASGRQSSWLCMQGHRGDLGRVSSRVSLGLSRLWPSTSRVHAWCGDGSAHTHTYGRRTVSHRLCTPTWTTFIHKSGESRRALLSPRSAFYERSVRCLSPDDAYKAHTHVVVSLHGGKKLCANSRDRYRRS